MRNYLILCLVILTAWIAPAGYAAESEPIKSGRATAQLVTSYDTVAPGQDLHIALSMRLEPHWHTYWRNAGGPGMPAEMHWDAITSLEFGEIIWPLPMLVTTGPIINYAFEDRLLLPMPLHIPDDAMGGEVITINAQASYLVCYEVCLPEMADLSLTLEVGEPLIDGRWYANIDRTLKNAPKLEDLQASAKLVNGLLQLDIAGGTLDFDAIKNPYFFPNEQDLIDASADQKAVKGSSGLRFNLKPSYGLAEGIKNVSGVFAFEEKTEGDWHRRGIIVNVEAGKSVNNGLAQSPEKTDISIGIWAALLGAFIGGLILNLMPCVFPVLSLKALGFARAAHHERSVICKHGWVYTAGVMLSFLGLAIIILVLKASGNSIGWGFQMQNPILVGALAVLFFAIALNLFGVFELGGRLQNTGANLAADGGNKGSFFTGVLAVIVATPCTAPFMAGALGFAFTQSALMLVLIFMALGVGFALPFLALSYSPTLLNKLPKPGPWMDTFKQVLAFPMLAAAIWLIWVSSIQTGAGGVLRLLSAMLLLGFALWVWKYKGLFVKTLFIASLLGSGYLIKELSVAEREQALAELPSSNVWSPARLAELRADGHTVFVDFTAAWCVTCKANEKSVLDRQATKELFAQTNTKLLVADWTRRDDVITAELSRHGRSGVPLYLVYGPGHDDEPPQTLPQILSYKIVEKALKQANQD